MKNAVTSLFLGALLSAPSIAQNTPPASGGNPGASQPQPSTPGQPASASTQPGSPASGPVKIAPGSVIPVQLAKTVDAKKAKTGDQVVATVTQDMKTNSGEVLVPKDTKILGHVTTAQARSKEQKESELAIAFDHAELKGDQMQLPMSIQAVIAPQPTNPAGGGSDEGAAAPSGGNSGNSGSPMAGRTPTGGTSQAPQPSSNYPPGEGSSQPQSNAHPPITGNTQGVIGMPNVKLQTAQNTAQGSLMTSEKNNVKIEKGTMMLLRVN